MNLLPWIGIVLCILQSGIFSGLNLAVFGLGRLELKALAEAGNAQAQKLLHLREDANFLLSTILWGNVGTNVLLTLLSESVLAGVGGFLFSTFVITFGGEIVPQAYFSRNALRMASLLRPVLRFWQVMLYPIAKPSALLLDAWLGEENIAFLREKEVRETLKLYAESDESEMSKVEGTGALNFLSLDDLKVSEEGEPIDPDSILTLPQQDGQLVFPTFSASPDDPWLTSIQASNRSWVILVSPDHQPRLALDADGFLRAVLFSEGPINPFRHCHRPLVVRDGSTTLGDLLPRLQVRQEHGEDDVVDNDLIVWWGEQKRVITGADLLGRLLRGILVQGYRRPE